MENSKNRNSSLFATIGDPKILVPAIGGAFRKLDPRILIQAEIIRPRRHRLKQFGDRALMHLGILPQIERRQTPAKNPHGAEQTTEPAMGEQRRTMQMQRFHHHR